MSQVPERMPLFFASLAVMMAALAIITATPQVGRGDDGSYAFGWCPVCTTACATRSCIIDPYCVFVKDVPNCVCVGP